MDRVGGRKREGEVMQFNSIEIFFLKNIVSAVSVPIHTQDLYPGTLIFLSHKGNLNIWKFGDTGRASYVIGKKLSETNRFPPCM